MSKGIPGFKETLDTMYSIMVAKNADYAGTTDPFANFMQVENLGISTAEKGILVRITDKLSRISNLLETEAQVKDEAITDTLQDMANYAVILKCLIEEKGKIPVGPEDTPQIKDIATVDVSRNKDNPEVIDFTVPHHIAHVLVEEAEKKGIKLNLHYG